MIFKQAFRLAFVALIWKQYKAVIISTIALFIYLFLVSSIHSDFLTHSELQKDASGSGLSFVYKWLAFALGVSGYFLFHFLRGKKDVKKVAKRHSKTASQASDLDEDDPFAAIRERSELRSRADFLEGKD